MLIRFDKRSEGAFTLTEVIVGICLLTIVWLAAVNVIIISRASGSLAKHKSQAVYLIQQKIENLRKLPYSSIASSNTTGLSIDTRGTPTVSADDLTGNMVVTVTTSSSSYAYCKKVVVELNWKESFFGKQKTVKEFGGTYIANDSQAN
ncbi:MAG: hypothetical protein WCY36_06340 [Candidatus Omnitrophota bacterium]